MTGIPILEAWKLPRDVSNAARAVVLIRPEAFGPNDQTRASNPFQGPAAGEAQQVAAKARGEVDALADSLCAAGVRTIILSDSQEPPKPDAVYPNNWVSFHAGGTALLFPMLAPVRRAEVRLELLEELRARHALKLERIIDLTPLAQQGFYLEGTGSMVLDRTRGLAFACRSPRTTSEGLDAFAAATGFELLSFEALDESGVPYYHTNVMLSVGDRFALVALEAIVDQGQRRRVREALCVGGRKVIALSRAQVRGFAANVLELKAAGNASVLALSTSAQAALGQEICSTLQKYTRLLPVDFQTIESVGGGGVRCALAGIH